MRFRLACGMRLTDEKSLEKQGIDPRTSRMLSGRSAIWATSPSTWIVWHWTLFLTKVLYHCSSDLTLQSEMSRQEWDNFSLFALLPYSFSFHINSHTSFVFLMWFLGSKKDGQNSIKIFVWCHFWHGRLGEIAPRSRRRAVVNSVSGSLLPNWHFLMWSILPTTKTLTVCDPSKK